MKYIYALILFYSSIAFGQSFPVNYISPSNIQWNSSFLPRDIQSSIDLNNWNKKIGHEKVSKWSYVSIINNNNEQVILQGSSPSSGGHNFIILAKQNGIWRSLIDIHGGFVLYPAPSSSPSLIVYQKSGVEYYRTEYTLKGNSFKKVKTTEVPVELTRLDNSPINFHKFFWYLNNGVSIDK